MPGGAFAARGVRRQPLLASTLHFPFAVAGVQCSWRDKARLRTDGMGQVRNPAAAERIG